MYNDIKMLLLLLYCTYTHIMSWRTIMIYDLFTQYIFLLASFQISDVISRNCYQLQSAVHCARGLLVL